MNAHLSRLLTRSLVAVSLLAGVRPVTASAFDTIKAQEANFPVPTPSATVDMGTFDYATGQFTGVVSTLVSHPPDQFNRKPYQVLTPPTQQINAVAVVLTFHAKNRPAGERLRAMANKASAAANSDVVSVDAGPADNVQWTVYIGNKQYKDSMNVTRPPIVGAGAFIMPALPLVVIYAPPVDQKGQNKTSYATTTTTGTTIGMTFSQQNSTSKPSTPSQFAGANDMADAMNLTATLISTAGSAIPGGAAIAGAFKKIAGALGTATANQEVGTTVSNSTSLQITDQIKDSYTSVSGKGPGVGDIILYLRNAQMIWLAKGGQVTLTLLGQQSIDNPSVAQLLADLHQPNLALRKTGLDNSTLTALLSLDPFTGFGPHPPPVMTQASAPLSGSGEAGTMLLSAASSVPVGLQLAAGPVFMPPGGQVAAGGLYLDPARYVLDVTYGVFTDQSHQFTHTVQQTDTHATTNFTTTTENYKAGFLSFLGVGPADTSTVKSNVTQGSSRAVTTGTQIQQQVDFHAAAGESYSVEVYYDRVFGTFAFKQIEQVPSGLVGVVKNATGPPVANQLVTIDANGRKYETLTDAQGNYKILASTLKPGSASASVGRTRVKSFNFKLGDHQDLVYTPPKRIGVPLDRR